jgi:hypothetical protein
LWNNNGYCSVFTVHCNIFICNSVRNGILVPIPVCTLHCITLTCEERRLSSLLPQTEESRMLSSSIAVRRKFLASSSSLDRHARLTTRAATRIPVPAIHHHTEGTDVLGCRYPSVASSRIPSSSLLHLSRKNQYDSSHHHHQILHLNNHLQSTFYNFTRYQYFSSGTGTGTGTRRYRAKKQRRKRSKQSTPPKGNKDNNQNQNPNLWRGPQGRPVMTEQRFLQDNILQDTLKLRELGGSNSPKVKLHNAKIKMDFDIRLEHKPTDAILNRPGNPLIVVRTTTSFSHPEDLKGYKTDHPHVSIQQGRKLDQGCNHNNDDETLTHSSAASTTTSAAMIKLVCMAVSTTKKRAESLAAADTLALLYEMGIQDAAHDPPDFRKERLAAARATETEAEELRQALFEADLSRAQMVLEILNVTRPTFETSITNMVNGSHQWTATATCLLRGHPLKVQGEEATSKAKAEGQAMIALAKSNELQNVVGKETIEMYDRLIESSPGQRIAALKISPLPDDLLAMVEESVGTVVDQERRIQHHYSVKDEYETWLAERGGRANVAKQRGKYDTLTAKEKERVNDTLKREEEKRAKRALEHPSGKEAAMKSVRDALPIKKIREELVEALKTQPVVVVSGGTGSG